MIQLKLSGENKTREYQSIQSVVRMFAELGYRVDPYTCIIAWTNYSQQKGNRNWIDPGFFPGLKDSLVERLIPEFLTVEAQDDAVVAPV